jgi:pimeloyl-ACP methyl ester carboxylesterase
MRAEEQAALAEAAGRGFVDVVRVVEGVHRAVLARAYRLIGAGGRAPQRVHEGVTAGVYACVRGVGGLMADGLSRALATRPTAETAEEDRVGAQWSAALCSAFGDHLAGANSPLALTMSLRNERGRVALTTESLIAAYPGGTRGIALFVHGLGMTEHAWDPLWEGSRHEPAGRDRRGYADQLAADLCVTPLYLRYNTGLHISSNGRLLADLLELLVRHWPYPLTRVVLVGHSMGGLVARSACHLGHLEGARWVPLVSDVVTLGSPHRGAPLERGANMTAVALRMAPETRPLAELLDRRSAGIKDLRFGYLTDQAWLHSSAHAMRDESADVPLLPTARHHVVAGTVWRSAEGWMSDLVGDLMIPPASATGRKRTAHGQPFPIDAGHRAAGVNHRTLLKHPGVYRVLRDRLR